MKTWADILATLQAEQTKNEIKANAIRKIRSICKILDGKIYNKRIAEAIYAGSDKTINAVSTSEKFRCWLSNTGEDIFSLNPRYHDYITNKRLDYEKLNKYLVKDLQECWKKKTSIESDILTGEELYKEMIMVKNYYMELGHKLSDLAISAAGGELEVSSYHLRCCR